MLKIKKNMQKNKAAAALGVLSLILLLVYLLQPAEEGKTTTPDQQQENVKTSPKSPWAKEIEALNLNDPNYRFEPYMVFGYPDSMVRTTETIPFLGQLSEINKKDFSQEGKVEIQVSALHFQTVDIFIDHLKEKLKDTYDLEEQAFELDHKTPKLYGTLIKGVGKDPEIKVVLEIYAFIKEGRTVIVSLMDHDRETIDQPTAAFAEMKAYFLETLRLDVGVQSITRK